uniref:DB domain-containing protein n=1 Tax=Heterorhabditis bacteriophora TaxID=37862 RepID=A0A1I7XQD6_HETBA
MFRLSANSELVIGVNQYAPQSRTNSEMVHKSYVPHTPPTGPAVSTAISPVTTLSSTIIKPLNSFSPQIIPSRPFLNPNQKIELCCKKQAVNPACQALCNFDSFNDKTLVSAFLTNQCPGPQLGQAYDCASSKILQFFCILIVLL